MPRLTHAVRSLDAAGMDLREYTPTELAAAIAHEGIGLDAVSFELQAADGTTLAKNVMLLGVEVEHDFDRTGGYAWLKITARLET